MNFDHINKILIILFCEFLNYSLADKLLNKGKLAFKVLVEFFVKGKSYDSEQI